MRGEVKFLLSLLLRFGKQSGIKFGHGFFGSFIWFGDFFGFVFHDSFKNLLILVLNDVIDDFLAKDQLKANQRQFKEIYPFRIGHRFDGTVRRLLSSKVFN